MPDAARRSTLNVPIRLISTILRNVSRLCGDPSRLIVRSAQPMPAQWMHVRSGAISVAARDRGRDLCFVGDVGLGERAVEFLGDDFALAAVAVDDDDVGALGGETAGRGFAHSGGPAGDEGSGLFE